MMQTMDDDTGNGQQCTGWKTTHTMDDDTHNG
jgi:hypothetical protein